MGGTTGTGSTAGRTEGGRGAGREFKPAGTRGGEGQRRRGSREQAGVAGESLVASARDLGENTVEMARDAAASAADLAADAVERGEESGRRVIGWVRENPWPSLLIGAGAAWLAIDAVRGRGDGMTDMERGRMELDEGGPGVVRRSMSSVADLSRRSISSVADAGRGAGDQVGGFVRENPLWAGLAALGIGVAVGLALPSTMPENRLLGQARDKVVRKARQVADSASETVREVAKSAGRIAGGGQGSQPRA
jgi:ElaB/YqjD/DUF883 family membrane-anchored ribosome-binding protein